MVMASKLKHSGEMTQLLSCSALSHSHFTHRQQSSHTVCFKGLWSIHNKHGANAINRQRAGGPEFNDSCI